MIRNQWERCVPVPKKAQLQSEGICLDNTWGISGLEKYPKVKNRWHESFRLSDSPCGKNVTFITENIGSESYRISIGDDLLKVTAEGEAGFNYALNTLWQLSPDGNIPKGTIEDWPDMKIRGFHVNFDSYHQMGLQDALHIVKNASELKLNTLLVECSERFPFEKHSRIKAPTALSREEFKTFVNAAASKNLELIPLQQCFGHLEYLLKHDEYSSVREEDIKRDQLCPENPDSFKLFTELAEEIISLYPGIRYFHIGGDETRRLGTCPKCRDKAGKYGISRLYVDYINKVCNWLKERNLTPIIWDDMLCAHPESIDMLDKDLVIMYWDYWTTGKSSPYFIARYNRKGKPVTIHDSMWDSTCSSELTDLERDIMRSFSQGVPLQEDLGKEFLSLYGPYLGKEFPKYIKGYPYLEFYQDKGFKVIGAPTALGNGDDYHTLPNYWRFVPNIKTVCERCKEAGAEGVISTAWYNYPPVMFNYGLAATAQFTW